MKNKNDKNKSLMVRFFPYLFKYKGVLFFDLFCAGLTTLTELILPLILRRLTDAGMGIGEPLTLTLVKKLALIYLILRTIDIGAQYYMAKIGHIMGARIETDMRRDAFHHLTELSVSFYNNTKIGQIMTRITNDLFDVTEFAHHCPEEFFIGGLKFLVSFIILLKINLPLTLAVFAMIPLMLIFASRYRKEMRRAFKDQRNQIGELNSELEDTLLGVQVVKSFAAEEFEKESFDEGNQKFFSIKERTYHYMAAFHTVTGIFDGLMYLIVIFFGGYLLLNNKISSGDLVAYILYVTALLATVRRVVQFMEQFQRGMTGIERFFEIMDTDIEIFDNENAIEVKDVKGDIDFENVSFSYPDDKENYVLENLNLHIEAGSQVALVGPSGGGKTTITNLIPRFFDVDSGSIKLDGEDIRNLQLKSLRENIGMVHQNVHLFAGTIRENINYGDKNATEEEIINAAKMAGAYDFIMDLPKGLDTDTGERGVKLSGGQKQRISIARVFLKNPPILLLDEATSALDNQSERFIQESLDELSKGRTTLTIAHRLSTIRNADLILVLTQDGLVERGTHKELLENRGLYYELYTQSNPVDNLLIDGS